MTSVYFNMSRIVTDSWLLPVLPRTRDCHETCETSQHWFRAPLQIACWVSQALNRSNCCTVMPLLSCLKAKTTTTLVPTTKYVSLDFISGHILAGRTSPLERSQPDMSTGSPWVEWYFQVQCVCQSPAELCLSPIINKDLMVQSLICLPLLYSDLHYSPMLFESCYVGLSCSACWHCIVYCSTNVLFWCTLFWHDCFV